MKMTAEDALATVSVMRMKEESDYRCEDYVTLFAQSHSEHAEAVLCRKLMAEWCLEVVDQCGLQKETAAIATNMLDRFLATQKGTKEVLKSRYLFQLASMTTLYTAIKVHEPEAVTPETCVRLSRGVFTVQEIEEMEVTILSAVQWRTNPPTPLTFVHHFLEIVPPEHKDRLLIYELAKVQTELVVPDYSYVTKNPSSMAYAALCNAVAFLEVDPNFLSPLARLVNIDPQQGAVMQDRMTEQLTDHILSTKALTSQQAAEPKGEIKAPAVATTSTCGQSSPRLVQAHII